MMPACAGRSMNAITGASACPASATSPRRSATYMMSMTGAMIPATTRNMRVARRARWFRYCSMVASPTEGVQVVAPDSSCAPGNTPSTGTSQ